MSIPQPPRPARLVIGLYMKDQALLEPLATILSEKFGPVEMVSEWLPFDYTDYYTREMGSPLFRRMLSFRNLIEQTDLPDIKLFTNRLESEYSDGNLRRVNIDPGYMLMERFVLATGKNFTHRIYIGKGIYADLTLIYQKGDFRTLPWTYPDYADERMISHLRRIRGRYAEDLKKANL